MTNIPINCTSCEYSRNCQSYYGGLNCFFRDVIVQKRQSLLERLKEVFKK